MTADDPVAEAVRRLYSVAPDDFMTTRTELSRSAREAGDEATAKAITQLRKPTRGASIVNRQVQADPVVVDRLLELGARLRAAHEDLDAAALRDLSGERRTLVAELSTTAFARAEIRSPTAALRDEVANTFDAAIADPQVAERLGRLVRPERWSGFGVASPGVAGAPELTLVRGGKGEARHGAKQPRAAGDTKRPRAAGDTRPTPDSSASASPSSPPPEPRRRLRRALDKAQSGFDRAESELTSAEADEQDARQRVRELGEELTRLQRDLDTAKQDLDQSRRSTRSARSRRRAARSALDRAERQLER